MSFQRQEFGYRLLEKLNTVYTPCPMLSASLLHHDRHNGILVRLPPLLMYPHHLIYPYVAHKVAIDEHKVGCDYAMGVDVAHRVARRERLFRSHDRHDLDS